MSFFDYTYYRVCAFYKKKKDSTAEVTGIWIVSLIQCFIILDLFVLVRIFYEYPIPDNFSKYWSLPIVIIIPIINWSRYVKTKKYREYRSVWRIEPTVNKQKKGWRIVLLLVISIGIPIIYGISITWSHSQ